MVSIQQLKSIKDFQPRRVKKYFFVWCSSGQLSIQVDQKLLKVKSNEVLTITSGQYHCFEKIEEAQGYLLSFTLDYMCKTEKDIELIFQNSLFCHFDYNEIIHIHAPEEIEKGLQNIERELSDKPYQYLESVHSRIELLLFEVNRSKMANGGEVWKPDALFLRFLEFVRNNFDKNFTLKEMAGHLHTTELKLNELAKLHAGKTAQNIIYGLIISEAQRIIQYEDKSIKEIAFALGFKDPYYFSKFFKHHTGQSPRDFQNSLNS